MKDWFRSGERRIILATSVNALLYGIALFPSLFDIYGSPLVVRIPLLMVGLTGTVFMTVLLSYMPYVQKKQQYTTKLMDVVVDNFLQSYHELNPTGAAIRINAMSAVGGRWYRPFSTARLQIRYSTDGYSEGELDMEYDVGTGCCGNAFELNKVLTFDRDPDDAKADKDLNLFRLDGTQKAVTRDVKSIISVPFYRPDDGDQRAPIGVLNIDSTEGNTEETGFEETQVVNLAITTAGFAGILFE